MIDDIQSDRVFCVLMLPMCVYYFVVVNSLDYCKKHILYHVW